MIVVEEMLRERDERIAALGDPFGDDVGGDAAVDAMPGWSVGGVSVWRDGGMAFHGNRHQIDFAFANGVAEEDRIAILLRAKDFRVIRLNQQAVGGVQLVMNAVEIELGGGRAGFAGDDGRAEGFGEGREVSAVKGEIDGGALFRLVDQGLVFETAAPVGADDTGNNIQLAVP